MRRFLAKLYIKGSVSRATNCGCDALRTDGGCGLTRWKAYVVARDETFAMRYIEDNDLTTPYIFQGCVILVRKVFPA